MRKFKFSPFIFVLALMLAVVSYGFAATNTVNPSVAGEGDGTISGVTVSAIHYNLTAANPSTFDSVSFTTSTAVAATGTVRVSVGAGASWSSWTTCTGAGTAWTCTFTTPVSVSSATSLRVATAD